eukprot:13016514-Ditylum_brightwellii.AAC.1
MSKVSKSTTRTQGVPLGKITQNDMPPGQYVSMDQYIFKEKGQPLHTASNTNEMFNGGTIFVNHASRCFFNNNQISLRSGETLQGKRLLQRAATDIDHHVQHLHADNGVFASKDFRADITRKNQTIRFSGVGAAHQNAIAER